MEPEKDLRQKVVEERSKSYGTPGFAYTSIGFAWTAILRQHLQKAIPVIDAKTCALMMNALKVIRLATPFPDDPDSYIDAHNFLDFARRYSGFIDPQKEADSAWDLNPEDFEGPEHHPLCRVDDFKLGPVCVPECRYADDRSEAPGLAVNPPPRDLEESPGEDDAEEEDEEEESVACDCCRAEFVASDIHPTYGLCPECWMMLERYLELNPSQRASGEGVSAQQLYNALELSLIDNLPKDGGICPHCEEIIQEDRCGCADSTKERALRDERLVALRRRIGQKGTLEASTADSVSVLRKLTGSEDDT